MGGQLACADVETHRLLSEVMKELRELNRPAKRGGLEGEEARDREL